MPYLWGPPAMSADAPEVYEGMLDRILALRNTPITPELLGELNKDAPIWRAHEEAIDACIDAMLPGLRRLVSLPARVIHDSHCVSKAEIERAIGRVPLDRNEKHHTGEWRTRE